VEFINDRRFSDTGIAGNQHQFRPFLFDDAVEGFYPTPLELKVVLAVCGLFNVLFFLYPGPLVGAASAACLMS